MDNYKPFDTRRLLLARLAALITATSSGLRYDGHAASGSDATMLAACRNFGEIEQHRMRFYEGPDRVINDDERDDRLTPLIADQVEILNTICRTPATRLVALRQKALVWLIWNRGELLHRTTRHGLIEDRLLASVFADLGCLS